MNHVPHFPAAVLAALVLVPQLLTGAETAAAAAPPRYSYPPQDGREQLLEQDPDCIRLTDGAVGSDFHTVIYGKWFGSEIPRFITDWDFPEPVRIKTIRFTLAHANDAVHPTVGLPLCHPARVALYGLESGVPEQPDAVFPIAYQPGPMQEFKLILPDGGMVTNKLRISLELARNQIALSEIAFESETVSPEELQSAVAARRANRPAPLTVPELLPRAIDRTIARPSPRSLFGVCGHLMHTDFFYHDPKHPQGEFTPTWRREYTIPWIVEGRIRTVREPIYGWWFEGDGEVAGNGNTFAENRAMVEADVAAYAANGIDVILTPFLVDPATPAGERHYQWLAALAQKYGNVVGFEMHNEPNLKGFWSGSIEEYVETARKAAAILRAGAPEVPIIVGSFSGWGHAPDLGGETHVYAGSSGVEAWNFAERAMQLGLLEFADGVATHPYRTDSPPEGGLEVAAADDPDGFEKEIELWWEMIQRYNTKKRKLTLHFTEIGFSASPIGYSGVGSETLQADYLSRLMLVLLRTATGTIPLRHICWYDLKQDDPHVGDYEHQFGLIRNDASQAREAFQVYARIAGFFDDPDDLERLDSPLPEWSNWPDAIKSTLWRRRSDGALLAAFWRMERLQKNPIDFSAALTLQLPENFKVARVRLHDLHEGEARSAGFRQEGNRLLVSPLHVTARAAWLEIIPEEKVER